MPSFLDLGLAEPICRALDPEAMPSPTPIQVRAIPPLLEGNDVLAVAPLGAGKTAAYLLPLLHRLSDPAVTAEPKLPRAIVLTAERDRAELISRAILGFARYVAIRSAATADAAGWNRQAKELRTGVEIVVATPKQLLELIRERAVGLRSVEFVVLDDADEMLELGHWTELERIALQLPEQRQVAMFAAASSPTIDELAKGWMREWVEVDAPAPKPKPKGKAKAKASIDPSLQVDPHAPPDLPEWLDDKPPEVALPDWLEDDTPVAATASPAEPAEPTDDAAEDEAAAPPPTPPAKKAKATKPRAPAKPKAKKKVAAKAGKATRKRS